MAEIIDAFNFVESKRGGYRPNSGRRPLPKVVLVEKSCSTCRVTKSIDEYYANSRASDSKQSECKTCCIARTKARADSGYYKKNYRKVGYKKHLSRKYGITLEQYNEMAMLQCGSCCICGDVPCESPEESNKSRLHVDHDHATNKIRGLICTTCNVTLGRMKDNPIIIRRLASYVEGTL